MRDAGHPQMHATRKSMFGMGMSGQELSFMASAVAGVARLKRPCKREEVCMWRRTTVTVES
jgi:hypothetical protein